ncbi:hypothetical protein [Gordonia aurantiaca]|uniref:hypothetical protein n=1 Tax=Gordonia sp. B21 TaxID=3151852 RepID=UPI003263D8A6
MENATPDDDNAGEAAPAHTELTKMDVSGATTSRKSLMVWVLGVAVVVLLMVASGLVGFIVATSRGSGGEQSGLPAAPETRSLSLRQTVDKMLAETTVTEAQNGEDAAWQAMKKYAEPACAAMIDGLVAAFGVVDDATAANQTGTKSFTEVRSVVERGNRGTVVMATGGKDETMYWLRRDGVWRFTCQDLFQQTEKETESTLTTTPTLEMTAEVPADASVELPQPSNSLRTTTIPNEDPNLDQAKWAECVRTHSNAECRELLSTNQK